MKYHCKKFISVTAAIITMFSASAMSVSATSNTATHTNNFAETYCYNNPYQTYAYARSKVTNKINDDISRTIMSKTVIKSKPNASGYRDDLSEHSLSANRTYGGFVQSTTSYSENLELVDFSRHYYTVYSSTSTHAVIISTNYYDLVFWAD